MDRVTGDAEATSMVTDAKTDALKCRAAQRMF